MVEVLPPVFPHGKQHLWKLWVDHEVAVTKGRNVF